MRKIILASKSPRRKELLEGLNIDFEVVVSDADEEKINKDTVPADMYVQELALLKATAVANELKNKNALIISADTIVYNDGEILGKPKNEDEARDMLKSLSGKKHSVYTGICVMNVKTMFSVCTKEKTDVYFKELSDKRIDDYIKTKEPFDKAGGYGIQALGSLLVEKIDGDYFNVVGLPIGKLCEVLEKEFDYDVIREKNI